MKAPMRVQKITSIVDFASFLDERHQDYTGYQRKASAIHIGILQK